MGPCCKVVSSQNMDNTALHEVTMSDSSNNNNTQRDVEDLQLYIWHQISELELTRPYQQHTNVLEGIAVN
jgi:hypothetical protein